MTPAERAAYVLATGQTPEEVGPPPSILTPGGALTTPQAAAPEDGAQRAMRLFAMTPEEIAAEPKPPELGGFNQRTGSFATGANDMYANLLGLPGDAFREMGNLGVRGINAVAGTNLQPVERSWIGRPAMRDYFASTVGRTEPRDEIDRLLYGGGAGAAAAVGGMGVGGALQAAGKAPAIAGLLTGGSESGLAPTIGNLAMGAAAGTGSVAGSDTVARLGGGPLAQALGSAVGGFGLGGAAALTPALATNAYRVGRAALLPFRESGRRDIAGRVLNQSATYGEPDVLPGPLGTNPTLGQASNDPGLLALERVVQQSSPDIHGRMAAQASENNQQIRNAFGLLGDPAGREPYQISQQAATGLEANRATARAGERSAWEAIDPTNSITVPMAPIRDRMQGYIDSLTMARRPLVPNDLVDMVMQSGGADVLPMRELQDIRSAITSREQMARRTGDYNQANVYRNLDETLFQGLPEGAGPLPTTADQAATARYQTAIDTSRQYNQTFNAKPIRDVFRVEGTPDSAVLDKMLSPGQGQSERVGQYVRATLGDPTLVQHGRDWFTAKMSNAVASARQDAEGDPFVLGNKLSQFVAQNRPLVDSPLFTPAQRQVIDNLVEAATMVERTARAGPVGGSDTAAKLAGKDYVSAFVGNWFKPVQAATEVAAAVPGFMAGGPGGAAAAVYGAHRAIAPLYRGAGEKVMELLSQAMQDPAFATELMRNASPGNAQFASPRLKNFLATLPLMTAPSARLSIDPNLNPGLSR